MEKNEVIETKYYIKVNGLYLIHYELDDDKELIKMELSDDKEYAVNYGHIGDIKEIAGKFTCHIEKVETIESTTLINNTRLKKGI